TTYPVDFQTLCSIYTNSFYEDFETTPTGSTSNNTVPNCWTYLATSATSSYGYTRDGAAYANSGNNGFYTYRTSTTGASYDGDVLLISPQTDNLGNGTKQIRFWAKVSSASYINTQKFEVYRMDGTTSSATKTLLQGNIPLTTSWQEFIIPLPNTTDDYFAFSFNRDGGASYVYLDDIYYEDVSSCIFPIGLNVSNIGETSVDVSWNASIAPGVTGYYYEVHDENGTVVKSGPVTGTSVNVTGLDPATDYTVYIRSVCGTSNGVWTTYPGDFQTLCQIFGNFVEDFDSTPVGSSSNPIITKCWSYICEITSTGYGYVAGTSSQSTPNSFRLYRTNSTTHAAENLVLISPETVNLGNGNKQLRFSAMATTTNASNILQIVRSNGTTSSSTFTVIQNIVVDHTGYKEYTVPLPATTDDYFGFRLAYNNTSTSIDINIDNVHYEDIPPLLVNVDKTDILCNGDNNGSAIAIVEGGVVPYTYSWSPSLDTTDAVSNLAPGQHTVTITDGRGTVKTATVTILEPAPLVSDLNFTDVSCNGKNDGLASVNPSGGTAPY